MMSDMYKSLYGRKKLLTHYLPHSMVREGESWDYILDTEGVCSAIREVAMAHEEDRVKIEYLMNYYKGKQDILDRVKDIRPDIDNRIVFNHAYQATRNIVGYTFGKPITYIQREESKLESVKYLNNCTDIEDKFAGDTELATIASICGVAYRGIFTDSTGFGNDVPFNLTTLDPQTTFVLYSTELNNPPVLACTYYYLKTEGSPSNSVVYNVYTPDLVFRFKSNSAYGSLSVADLMGEPLPNVLGKLPIVEYENNMFRMGDWETAVSLLNAINVVGSDSVNDLSQFVQSLLVITNADFTDDDIVNLKKNKIIKLLSQKDNPADMKYIANQLDANGAVQLRDWLLSQFETVVGIPSRSRNNGSSDTGDAVYMRNGYESFEIVARLKESSFRKGERLTLDAMLGYLSLANKLKGLSTSDIIVKFTRNSTDNILVKSNAISILNGTKTLAPTDILALVGISTEPAELAKRGDAYWKKKTAETVADTPVASTPSTTSDDATSTGKSKAVNNTQNKSKVER